MSKLRPTHCFGSQRRPENFLQDLSTSEGTCPRVIIGLLTMERDSSIGTSPPTRSWKCVKEPSIALMSTVFHRQLKGSICLDRTSIPSPPRSVLPLREWMQKIGSRRRNVKTCPKPWSWQSDRSPCATNATQQKGAARRRYRMCRKTMSKDLPHHIERQLTKWRYKCSMSLNLITQSVMLEI